MYAKSSLGSLFLVLHEEAVFDYPTLLHVYTLNFWTVSQLKIYQSFCKALVASCSILKLNEENWVYKVITEKYYLYLYIRTIWI